MARREKELSVEKDAFVDHVVSVRRVTKVTKGGKRFSISAFVITGNQQGQVGIALGKSKEATSAITKATNRARKNLVTVTRRGVTIPYKAHGKHGSAKVVLVPASKGTGKIAGGSVRSIMDAAGIEDILTKSTGAGNPINVAKATLNALAKLRSAEHLAKLRGTTVNEMVKGA